MNEFDERAFQYRQRAEELRNIIPDMKDSHTRETIERIIRNYDNLADEQEKLAKFKISNSDSLRFSGSEQRLSDSAQFVGAIAIPRHVGHHSGLDISTLKKRHQLAEGWIGLAERTAVEAK